MAHAAGRTSCLHTSQPSVRIRAFLATPFRNAALNCRRKARQATASSYNGGSSSSSGPSRLIIPGNQSPGDPRQQQQNRSGSNSGLIMPGKGGQAGHGAGLGNTPVNNFKPPPGFMDSPNDAKHPVAEDPQKLLQKLKTGNGYWHELATALPALQRAGFDWLAIEAETGLERALQSIWTIAGQVFESLKQQANFPDEKLRYFNTEDSEYKLYPMRVLAVQARGPVAEYIVDHDLNTKDSEVLIKAFKEHERRDGEKEGFAHTPADALAFKFYRDAGETRRKHEIHDFIERGLAVAESERAKATLRAFIQEEATPSAAPADAAQLAILRLTYEEMSFRAVAVAGNWSSVSAAAIQQAPLVKQQHPFSIFETRGQQQWVMMPAWSAVMVAAEPVALVIDDCAKLEVLMKQLQKAEDKKRLQGQGLLLIDRVITNVSESEYYLVDNSGCLELKTGSQVAGQAAPLARVLFCSRPPIAEMAEISYP
ncbi:hypothetical protein ABBQ32_006204 [Trebouxia sp. C0010 RCD-2024]